MDNIEEFSRKISSLVDRAYSGKTCLLGFLDEAEQAICNSLVNKSGVGIYYNGGITNCDRKRAIISLYEIDDSDFKITVYKIEYNKKFGSFNHRNVLGSLMSLGIKRECIGDIVFYDNKDCYFSVTDEIKDYIKAEFTSIGHTPITLVEETNVITNVIRYEEVKCFLASMRLDVVIAGVYNLSRSEASTMIFDGLVLVNHLICQNSSHVVNLNDEITVRHKGRFVVSNIGGSTRSGRIMADFSKRI